MNPKSIEAGQKKFDHFKKTALLVFTTALRAPLMLMMGCGYVQVDGVRHHLHDYGGKLTVGTGSFYTEEPYDQEKHGKIVNFVKQGERIPDDPNSEDGRVPIHCHNRKPGSGGVSGPYEYSYEKQ